MNEIYQQIKSECELPIALLSYTYRDFDGVLQLGNITISFKDNDETNIEKMEKIKSKYGEFFMFFNHSTEGKEFWKNNPITITPKQQKFMNNKSNRGKLIEEVIRNYVNENIFEPTTEFRE